MSSIIIHRKSISSRGSFMKAISRIVSLPLSAAVLLTATYPAVVQAQNVLEEIVVTAQRREQSLQDVPISIETVSGDDIEMQGFRDLDQMATFTPGLNINGGEQNAQSIRIRGVGSDTNNLALEQSVAMFVDGVHYGRGSNIFSAFLDVERVEILRGPQPIYFGQNASAGAISVTTRKPTPSWEGYVNVEAGNDAIKMGEFGAGGPLTDTLGVRVAGKYDYSEGFMIDITRMDKYPEREAYSGRTTFQWTPSDSLQAMAKIEYVNVERFGDGRTPVAAVARADRGIGAALTGDFDAFDAAGLIEKFNVDTLNKYGFENSGPWFKQPLTVFEGIGAPPRFGMADLSVIGNDLPVGPFATLKLWSNILELNYTFANDITLTSQTSYVNLDRDYARDGQSSGPFLLVGNNRFEFLDQYSQEIRLTSPTGEFLEWMAGVYWQHNNLNTGSNSYRAAIDTLSAPRSNIQGNRHGEDDDWLSGFAALTFNFTDVLSLDVGARYTDVKKEGIVRGVRGWWLGEDGEILVGAADHGKTAVAHTPIDFTGNVTEGVFEDSRVDPQIVLRWRPSESISTYAKYATGMKSGGFDGSVTRVLPEGAYIYDSEYAENWEVGAKGDLLDGRANYSMTLFWNEFTNMQLTAFDEFLGQSTTNNVAEQRVRGAEFAGQMAVSDRLTLGLTGTIMDGEMVSYPGASCTEQEVFIGVCGTGGIPDRIDRSGQEALYTPDWTFALRGEYWFPVLNNYKVTTNANFLISDGYLLDFDEIFVMEQYENLNLNLGFGDQEDVWRVSLWGRNILSPKPTYQPEFDLDDESEAFILSASAFTTYGVQLRYNF